MKTIEFCGDRYRVESWWNFITSDVDGEITLFYFEPLYIYHNGYQQGRFWDMLTKHSSDWKELCVHKYVKSVEIKRI